MEPAITAFVVEGLGHSSSLQRTSSPPDMCGHGERAMTASSIAAAGARDVRVLVGGPDHWARETGTPLERG